MVQKGDAVIEAFFEPGGIADLVFGMVDYETRTQLEGMKVRYLSGLPLTDEDTDLIVESFGDYIFGEEEL